MKGKGWHLEPVRHSRARRFGSAGGKMPSKFKNSKLDKTIFGKYKNDHYVKIYLKNHQITEDAQRKNLNNKAIDDLKQFFKSENEEMQNKIMEDLEDRNHVNLENLYGEDYSNPKTIAEIRRKIRKANTTKTLQEKINENMGHQTENKVYFVKVGKGLEPKQYDKLSDKEIKNLVRKGYAVSRITEVGNKTEIFTYSPRTKEEAIKQENRLFG